jgi:hypothetical protein
LPFVERLRHNPACFTSEKVHVADVGWRIEWQVIEEGIAVFGAQRRTSS